MADNTTVSSKDILHTFFPALFIGLAGLFIGVLFAQVFGAAGGGGFFANTGDMATFGFFIGFVGRMSIPFEKFLTA